MISADQTVSVNEFLVEMVGGISAPQDPDQSIISYSDYLMNIKKQVTCARKLKDILTQHEENFSLLFANWKKPSHFE